MLKIVGFDNVIFVSPYIGEWIEIPQAFHATAPIVVSPYIGEWIEIENPEFTTYFRFSLTLHR